MAELPGVQRETLDVDVVIVGAGPAGLAAAYQLARLIKAHNETAEKKIEPISIAVLEKGKEIGSHGISGAVMDPRGIAELMPDWLERGCPIESPVTDHGFWMMGESWKVSAPILPPPLQNHGNYVISSASSFAGSRRSPLKTASISFPNSQRRACSWKTGASSACAPATKASTRTDSANRITSRASTSARRSPFSLKAHAER